MGVGDPNYGTRIEAGHISWYSARRIWAGLDGIGWMNGKMDTALDRCVEEKKRRETEEPCIYIFSSAKV